MLFDMRQLGSVSLGSATEEADTIITQLVPPLKGAYTCLSRLEYATAGTAHTLTVLRPFNYTTIARDAASGQAVVNLVDDPGAYSTTWIGRQGPPGVTPAVANNAIAADDFVVYELPDGNFVLDTVNDVTGLAITLNTNVPTGGVKAGARFWFYGVTTDTNPQTRLAHAQFPLTAASNPETTTLQDSQGVWFRSLNRYDPLILHSDNATAAGTLQRTNVLYLKH